MVIAVVAIIPTPALHRLLEVLLLLEDPVVGEVGVGVLLTIRPITTAPVCLTEEEEEEEDGGFMVDQLDRHGRPCSTILLP